MNFDEISAAADEIKDFFTAAEDPLIAQEALSSAIQQLKVKNPNVSLPEVSVLIDKAGAILEYYGPADEE